MFNIVKGLKTTLKIDPNYLDLLKDQRFILEQIKQKVEGKYFESEGFIILVRQWLTSDKPEFEQLDEAFIEEDGSVKFKVLFEAITFELKNKAIVDCVCTGCEVECLNAKLGPVDIVIARDDIPKGLEYYQQSQCYKNKDQEVVIEIGTKLRVQIVQTRYKNGLKAVARLAGGEIINNICGILDDDLRL